VKAIQVINFMENTVPRSRCVAQCLLIGSAFVAYQRAS